MILYNLKWLDIRYRILKLKKAYLDYLIYSTIYIDYLNVYKHLYKLL